MALKIISLANEAISIDGKHKLVAGYLAGYQKNVGRFKSHIYHIDVPKRGVTKVWGNSTIDNALCDTKGAVNPLYLGAWVQIKHLREERYKKGKQTKVVQRVEVAVDLDRQVDTVSNRTGQKSYDLKKVKK